MSVQAGIWNFGGRPVDRKLIAQFSEAVAPQGPDGQFFFVDQNIGLLFKAFHTTEESRRETQPYISRRGCVLTWDGRLDNREELIADLHFTCSAKSTDVEIVAAAFDEMDANCFRCIIGDWAASVWKPKERELIFAVDYMAIRHLFYYLKEDCIWWSTDITPLVLFSHDRFHIDDDYVAGYFANDPDAHRTPYSEIRQAPPGQFIRVHDGKASMERFWRFHARSRISYKSDAEYEENFRHIFRQSVRRRLRSDSPILAELSGGLDSSSIVCMADDVLARSEVQLSCLDTISYYDNSEPAGDDWIYFHEIEKSRGRLGIHIDMAKLRPIDFLQSSAFTGLPSPVGPGVDLESERMRILREGRYRVVLSGLGGDEFLGGVPNPTAQLADAIVQFRIATLSRQLIAWSLVKRIPWLHLLRRALLDLVPTSFGYRFMNEAKVERWIQAAFAHRTKIAIRQVDVEEHFGLLLPSTRSYIGGVFWMANKMAKRQALPLEEKRYPYLDRDLIEFILSIPPSQLLRPGERRSLMRRSLAGLVPAKILSRRTKQLGARAPIAAIQRQWHQLETEFYQLLTSRMGFVDRDLFLSTLRDALHGKTVHISRLMKTVSLEFWLRELARRRLIEIEPTTFSEQFVCTALNA